MYIDYIFYLNKIIVRLLINVLTNIYKYDNKLKNLQDIIISLHLFQKIKQNINMKIFIYYKMVFQKIIFHFLKNNF